MTPHSASRCRPAAVFRTSLQSRLRFPDFTDHLQVFSDRLRLVWRGNKPRKTLLPWPEDLMFPNTTVP